MKYIKNFHDFFMKLTEKFEKYHDNKIFNAYYMKYFEHNIVFTT